MTKPNLRAVPSITPITTDQLRGASEDQACARRIGHSQLVEALALIGLNPRYVQAIGIKDDGIWVHSIMPGKTGGVLVAKRSDILDPNYVEYLPVDGAAEVDE